MKKQILFIFMLLIAFVGGYSLNNMAVSDVGYKVAVVDVQSIISKSSEVNNLKAAQKKKLEVMQATLVKAQQEIAKETDPAKASQLEEKYRNDINNQKIAMDTEYNNKLQQIDSNIKNIVMQKAKEMKYDLVLPKSMTLTGGDDITAEIAKLVK